MIGHVFCGGLAVWRKRAYNHATPHLVTQRHRCDAHKGGPLFDRSTVVPSDQFDFWRMRPRGDRSHWSAKTP